MNISLKKLDVDYRKLLEILPMNTSDQERLDKKMRLDFNFHSNSIEGSTLTYSDTELLLLFDETIGNHRLREYEEMKSHDLAYVLVQQEAFQGDRPLNESWIKSLNNIILVRPFYKEAITESGDKTQKKIIPGQYKNSPNSVRLSNGEIFHYSSPQDTPIEMSELITWFRENEIEGMHPVRLAALLHYKFVRIHPFDDGNGRVARLLMNYVLLKNKYPPVVIKKENKQDYIYALHLADIGETEAFVDYIIEQVRRSISISIKAAKGESIDELGDLTKKIAAFKRKIGEPVDGYVVKYCENAVLQAYDNCIVPLIKAWEQKLKELDVFFYSRITLITGGIKPIGGANFDLLLQKLRGRLWKKEVPQFFVKDLIFQCHPIGVRKLDKGLKLNGGYIRVRFEEHVYEILTIADDVIIDKLYTDSLNQIQIDQIAENLGNWLFSLIEQEHEKVNLNSINNNI